MGGHGPDPKNGVFLGTWGNLVTIVLLPGSRPQKGVTTYSISPNRQRPLAGTLHAAIFNTWRRFRGQALYVIPPFAIAYMAMEAAIERNEYLNSKPGRLAEGGP